MIIEILLFLKNNRFSFLEQKIIAKIAIIFKVQNNYCVGKLITL